MRQEERPEIVFVLANILGGIAYFNKNIINNTSLKEKAYIRVILIEQEDWDHPPFADSFDADEVVHFKYTRYENKHAVMKRLSKQFGTAPGAIVCNDRIEMEAIYAYGTNKTVYQLIHDFYNLKLSVQLGAVVDVNIAHSVLYNDVLVSADPARVQVRYLPHGVTIRENVTISPATGILRIVFTGRLTESKGAQDLYEINQLLSKEGIKAEWTIIGRGAMKNYLEEQWKGETNIRFASPDTNEEVMEIMSNHDIFILPTRFEGSPVAILEALSSGLAPVVSDLPGGIREVVQDNIGRTIPIGNNKLFAEAIAKLHYDRPLLTQLRVNARKLALDKYNIRVTSDNYFNLFLQFASFKKEHRTLSPLPVGFRLDKKWLPNSMVSFIRRRLMRIK